ncbi:MAG: cation-translocating P-type ATPase [Alphaproteobacteria bacterium]|nr:cation-translocating P-type ATPase [Alphaproteobacteria bacterium]
MAPADGPGRRALLGLTAAEVAAQRARFGRNELPRPPPRTLLRIVFETLREPMFLLMIGAAVLYLVLGDLAEGAFLVAAAAASLGLVIAQENRSERALAALRDLAQPQARVIRDGAERRIPAGELVPGDVMLVAEGERLPADALLVAGDVLSVDESALTGESAPVSKRPALAEDAGERDPHPGAAIGPHLFAGTVVTRGQGVAEVHRTGADSALGRIGASLAAIQVEATPLQKAAGRLVAFLGAAALGFCVLIALAFGLLRGAWSQGALAGITAAISLVPEEFPMVLAVFLALGAWRLAQHRVLVRRSAVIEALGSATVLCVDKTGTLTENRMRVARLWGDGLEAEVGDGGRFPEAMAELVRIAALASAVRPTDPMDRAVRSLAERLPRAGDLSPEPERTWPLRPERMALVQAWRRGDGARILAAKGAPEAVAALCSLAPPAVGELMGVVAAYADHGLRVLAVASAECHGPPPDDPDAVPFRLAGLIGFLDPLRADVPAALREARGAGIAVTMITGDHPATALAIARAGGLDVTAGAMTGADIAALTFPALRERLQAVRVFARITPDQKLLIVEALKANGEVVVMTGDGVNDAPALQAAHIGVAMGQRGTDVAREAAALVLLDDSFASIVGGVRLGRRIFVNLRRALTYVTAIHVPIAGLALLPILFGLPQLLFPMHVVLLELAIDPICALVFEGEPAEEGAMKRPPRRADEPLFGRPQLLLALAQGGALLAAVLGLYAWALGHDPVTQARGAAFTALVLGNLTLALADAFSSGGGLFAPYRRPYWLIAGFAGSLLAVVLAVPFAGRMFELARPPGPLLAAAIATSVAAGGWWGLVRRLRRSA